MQITREFVLSGQSKSGGWNKLQMQALGVPWPPVSGWMGRIIGREVADDDARVFLKMTDWISPATRKKYGKLYRRAILRAAGDGKP